MNTELLLKKETGFFFNAILNTVIKNESNVLE